MSRPRLAEPWIFHATLWTHGQVPVAPPGVPSGDVVSSLQVYERTGTNGLTLRASKIFDEEPQSGLATHPKLFGIAAIAVGDVDGTRAGTDPDADAEAELVIGTLNHDLVVIDLDTSSGGVQLGATRYWKVLDGSVGGCDAIRIEDLDPAAPGNEIYVVTSCGIRKFVQVQL